MKREPNLPRFGRDQSFPEESLGAYLPAGASKRAPEPAHLAPTAAMSALAAALDRLEEAIDEETAALEAHKPIDMEEVNARKSRSLLELTRLSRAIPPAGQGALRLRLARLQMKLTLNRSVLNLNLEAVREIADLLLGALGEAESDGTYDMAHGRRKHAQ